MANKIFQAKSYFNYWLDAVDEHSLHSPFFFDFYTQVVKAKNGIREAASIETLRQKLLQDQGSIEVVDLGAGGSGTLQKKSIADIAKRTLSRPDFSSLYARMISYFNAKTILELGTAFGINTLYLAHRKDTSVTTFEGSPEIANTARSTFEFAGAKNIDLIVGNLDTTLSSYLQSIRKVDFVFIDANHRFYPTLKYADLIFAKVHSGSVLVIDDIHYSREMALAWEKIRGHKLVYGSADLFRCGIAFFDPSLNKQHVVLQF
ncbi:MAG: O-methyltransferase [Bacteroidota bacterium]